MSLFGDDRKSVEKKRFWGRGKNSHINAELSHALSGKDG